MVKVYEASGNLMDEVEAFYRYASTFAKVKEVDESFRMHRGVARICNVTLAVHCVYGWN